MYISKFEWFELGTESSSNLSSEELDLLSKDHFVDFCGHKVNWTNSDDGWNESRRIQYTKYISMAKNQMKMQPKRTEFGYKTAKIPLELYQLILAQKSETSEVEGCITINLNCESWNDDRGTFLSRNNTRIFSFASDTLIKEGLNEYLKPKLEEFSGLTLNDVGFYGIRRYLNGACLWTHVDRLPTHQISAILQIDQKIKEDWPLLLVDHKGQNVQIMLKPGEMLLYESAVVPHGRPIKLNGDFYDNLLVFSQPVKKYNAEL